MMRQPHLPALTLVLLGVVLQLRPYPASGQVQVRDSVGVRIVLNEVARTSAAPMTIDPSPLSQIGALDGPAPFQFQQILDAKLVSGQTVAVLDGQTKTVRFFDASGSHLGTHGGQGLGPGEFRGPWRLAAIGGDTVAVWDYSRRTVAWFSVSSGFLDQQSVRGPQTFHEGEFTDNAERLIPHYPSTPAPRPASQPTYRTEAQLVVIPVEATSADTLATFRYHDLFTEHSMVDVPFYRSTHLASGGPTGRIAVGDNDTFDVWIFEGTELVMKIRAPSLQRRTEQSDIDAFRADQRASGIAESLVNRRLRGLSLYDRVPAFTALHLDPDGCLWAELYPATDGSISFAVLDDEGLFQGRVSAPPGLRVLEIYRDRVLGVWRDEFDVEYVRVHALRR